MPILYTRYQCSACDNVKNYLREHAIAFDEVNIMEDYARAMTLVQDGIRSVPVLELATGERFLGAESIKQNI